MFVSGYTHFTHYWTHADFSWRRLGTVRDFSTSYICTVHIYRHGDEVDGGHYLHVHTLSIHACIWTCTCTL